MSDRKKLREKFARYCDATLGNYDYAVAMAEGDPAEQAEDIIDQIEQWDDPDEGIIAWMRDFIAEYEKSE